MEADETQPNGYRDYDIYHPHPLETCLRGALAVQDKRPPSLPQLPSLLGFLSILRNTCFATNVHGVAPGGVHPLGTRAGKKGAPEV